MRSGTALVFQAFGLDQQIRKQSFALHQSFDEVLHTLALLHRLLGKLDAHSEFGVHDAHHTLGLDVQATHSHGKHDQSANREGRRHLEITAAQTQIGELAAYGGIVFLKIRGLLAEPRLEFGPGLRTHIDEADTSLARRPLPCDLGLRTDSGLRARQGEINGDGASYLGATRQFEGHATFADIRGHGLLFAGAVDAEHHRNLDRDPRVAPALPFHQGTGGAKAGFRPFGGNRLIENEVGSQFKRATQRSRAFEYSNRNRASIAGSGAGTAKNPPSCMLAGAVHDNGFESLPGQLADRSLGISAVLDMNLQIAQHAAQHAQDLFVRAKYQRLQTHDGSSTPGLVPNEPCVSRGQLPRDHPLLRLRPADELRYAVPRPHAAAPQSAFPTGPARPASCAALHGYLSRMRPS